MLVVFVRFDFDLGEAALDFGQPRPNTDTTRIRNVRSYVRPGDDAILDHEMDAWILLELHKIAAEFTVAWLRALLQPRLNIRKLGAKLNVSVSSRRKDLCRSRVGKR